jgi:probable HAF family extracellular repeat protein
MNSLRTVALISFGLLFSCQLTRADSYTYTLLSIPGGDAEAADINNLGQVVGVYFPRNGTRSGFFYDHGSYTLASLPPSMPYMGSDFFALNDVGQIVGFGTDPFTLLDKGFLDDHGVFSSVNVPGSATTIPYGINNSGVIVGTYQLPGQNTNYGFIRSAAGVYTTVSIPGASGINLSGINDLGQISGYYSDATGNHSFLYTNGQITPLGEGGGAINNLGQITLASGVLNPDGTISLVAVPGYDNTAALGINDAGQVTGQASSQSGMYTSFIATPTTVPEPQAL